MAQTSLGHLTQRGSAVQSGASAAREGPVRRGRDASGHRKAALSPTRHNLAGKLHDLPHVMSLGTDSSLFCAQNRRIGVDAAYFRSRAERAREMARSGEDVRLTQMLL